MIPFGPELVGKLFYQPDLTGNHQFYFSVHRVLRVDTDRVWTRWIQMDWSRCVSARVFEDYLFEEELIGELISLKKAFFLGVPTDFFSPQEIASFRLSRS